MPEFVQKDLKPFRTINIHFRNQKDIDEFFKLINQKVYKKYNSYWYPEKKWKKTTADLLYIDKEDINES